MLKWVMTCTHEGCERAAVARGFCSMHYQRLRLRGELERRGTDGVCAYCGNTFDVGTFGRPAKYCSDRCKERARYARKRGDERRATNCGNCGASLEGKRPHARFCSEKCGQDWRNAQMYAKARAEKMAQVRTCIGCGRQVPSERRANARYCSDACKLISRRHQAYGLTRDALDALLIQHEVCAICKLGEWGPKGPQVDHDHTTGKVRGILCTSCNQGLGRFKDSVEILETATAYLRSHLT